MPGDTQLRSSSHLRIVRIWNHLSSSFWFIPCVMALLGTLMTLGIAGLDLMLRNGSLFGFEQFEWVGPTSTRALLTTTASGAITVTGVIFSITIVVLSMASSQFGPRLLRNFMQDGSTQVVLGSFMVVFISCLLMLMMVTDEFAPQLSLIWGALLALASFCALIYFIHHVALFIQAPRIIDNVAQKLSRSITENLPARDDERETRGDAVDSNLPEHLQGDDVAMLRQTKSGYVQVIDYERLQSLATSHELVVRVLRHAGNFVMHDQPVLQISPGTRLQDEKLLQALRKTVIIGTERTGQQDPEFAIDQLVEVALRAMSTGINDPFTAITCIDRIGDALALLAERHMQDAVCRDDDGQVRVIRTPHTYSGLVNAALDQPRQIARDNAALAIRLLDVITTLARRRLPPAMREALTIQAEAIHEGTHQTLTYQKDCDDFRERYVEVMTALRERT